MIFSFFYSSAGLSTFIKLNEKSFYGVLMSKRSPKGNNRKAAGVPRRMDLNSVEQETMARVNKTLKVIGNFLQKWNKVKKVPEDMMPQIKRIRKFHKELAGWQKNALKATGKESDEARVKRLREFVEICLNYS